MTERLPGVREETYVENLKMYGKSYLSRKIENGLRAKRFMVIREILENLESITMFY
jgi:hypothetical protein